MSDRHNSPEGSEPLRDTELGEDPLAAFQAWFDAARDAGEPMPEAMALATASSSETGPLPAVRMVLLRGLGEEFRFFTNYGSAKAAELESSEGACALLFHWHLPRHRQVRVLGVAARLTTAESAAYFATRPAGSRVSAWASPQSRVVPDRDDLERRWDEARRQHGDDPSLPDFWGGYGVTPLQIEFWQSGADRLHDRIRFRREGTAWVRERLAP